MNRELKLLQLCVENDYISEMYWCGKDFIMHIPYINLEEFMRKLYEILGNGAAPYKAYLHVHAACIVLNEILEDMEADDIDLKEVFPVEKYNR